MMLAWILGVTAVGGVAAWVAGRWSRTACSWVSLLALIVDAALLIPLLSQTAGAGISTRGPWLVECAYPWIAPLGISFHLAADGLSLLLLALTILLGIVAVLASWTEIQDHVGAFHLALMLTLAGVLGVFTAVDLFLFYFFWELMLVPMYFLISVWGHENRSRAAIKFFLFTQAGSLLMFVAILTLYVLHGHATGVYTFDLEQLMKTDVPGTLSFWLMLGFFASFAVKLPMAGLHTWLPDAHTEAPTAGSVVLAGLLLKTGAYGLLRFALPLFPKESVQLAPAAMILGVIGILYGAYLAFAQSDAKRLVAYTSVSHLGFVLLGVYAGNRLALQGAVVILLAHGLSTGGLFVVVGILQERFHTRRMDAFGGLWQFMPRLGGAAMFLALASLGLPGLANFVGEFLVLTGTYAVSPVLASVGALGFVLSSIYSLWLIYQVFHGPVRQEHGERDLRGREIVVFALLIVGILGLGLYPQPVLNAAGPQVDSLVKSLADRREAAFGTDPGNHTFEAANLSFGAQRDSR